MYHYLVYVEVCPCAPLLPAFVPPFMQNCPRAREICGLKQPNPEIVSIKSSDADAKRERERERERERRQRVEYL